MNTGTSTSGLLETIPQAAGVRRSIGFKRLWLLAALPFVVATGFFLSLLLSEVAFLRFAADADGLRAALLFLLLASLIAVSAAVELDVRLRRIGGNAAESARGMLGVSSFLAFVLFLIWAAAAFDRSAGRSAGVEFLLCALIIGICAPLLWSAAKEIDQATYRCCLLFGFVIVTAALELAFDTNAGDAEERFFFYQSSLLALAIAVRLVVWGVKEFRVTS